MDHPVTPDNPESGQSKAHALATTLIVHGVMSLCITVLIVAPIIAGYAPNWASWMLVLLVGTPILCLFGGVLLRAGRHSARAVASLALMSILPFWGCVTLPITGYLIFLCVYGLEGSQPDRPADELPFYIGHAVFWLIAWYVTAGRHLRWLRSPTARVTLTARSPLRVWRSLRYAIWFISLFIAGTAFFTVRTSLITATENAGHQHNTAFLQQVWTVPSLLLPRRVKERVVVDEISEYGPAEYAWFLDHGLSPDAPGTAENTALHYACMRADVGMVRFLLSRGARVNIRENRGETPVYWLVAGDTMSEGRLGKIEDRLEILALLVKAGADLDIAADNGSTPLSESRNTALTNALRKYGASSK